MSTLDMILWILATLCWGVAAFAGSPGAGGAPRPLAWFGWGWLGLVLVGLSVILPG
jgi:hypothetical protein